MLVLDHVSLAYAPGPGRGLTSLSSPPNGPGLALDNVTFTVAPGRRVAVLGPNGAGKSTLFKLIAGVLRPSRGVIRVYGAEPGEQIRVAYVPQRSQIDWSFPVTAEDVVMMGRVGQIGLFRPPRRRDWSLVRASLERVEAAHLAKKQIGELSGGQQQRLFIARALAQEAELLLLDEPFAGLDLPGQEAIAAILDGLSGVTILVATHDFKLAADHFDDVLLLNRRLIAYGPPAEALAADRLLEAYGGHLHRLGPAGDTLVVADDCCPPEPEPGLKNRP
jgi:ABC-type Mn2+/Zn2+ transport system ATPase subunit